MNIGNYKVQVEVLIMLEYAKRGQLSPTSKHLLVLFDISGFGTGIHEARERNRIRLHVCGTHSKQPKDGARDVPHLCAGIQHGIGAPLVGFQFPNCQLREPIIGTYNVLVLCVVSDHSTYELSVWLDSLRGHPFTEFLKTNSA